jgi:hypothetical protein
VQLWKPTRQTVLVLRHNAAAVVSWISLDAEQSVESSPQAIERAGDGSRILVRLASDVKKRGEGCE